MQDGHLSSPQTGSAYNYVVTAQKPTSIRFSLVGRFTSPDDTNLIISKTTRIEIHTLTEEGLQGVADVPIYGRVAAMELFRPPGKKKDLLFFLTQQFQFSLLEYDSQTGEVVTQAMGEAGARVGRPNENGITAVVDPACRMIALHIYDAIVKIIPVDDKGKLQEAWDQRIDEMSVLDLKFLHGCSKPTLAVLHEDPNKDRHLRTYEVINKEKTFSDGPWKRNNLDVGANVVIPVPSPFNGALVLGESVITYFNGTDRHRTVGLKQTKLSGYGQVDEDGSRYLLGDTVGNLYLLVLMHDDQHVLGLKLEQLGKISAPSSISYLDNGVVFIGSIFADSQLIRLHPEPISPGNFVEVMDTFINLGPIVDFCVVDLDRQGQGQVVTCSGVRLDGSLRIVRNGIGMIGQVTTDVPGIRGLWSLRASFNDQYDSLLVLTFVGETRFLAMSEEDELEETEAGGFDSNSQTLYCGNAVHDQYVQVTPSGVRLLSAASKQTLITWEPPSSLQINVAAGNPSQILSASGSGNLVLLEIGQGQLAEKAATKLPSDIACLDITPLQTDHPSATVAAVGMWDQHVHLLKLPELSTLNSEKISGDVIPRSVLFTAFEGISYLLVALGDGRLFNFNLSPTSGALSDRKNISLGTKPITLRPFTSNGTRYVFASSDRPTIIYSSNQKLLYSNLNEDEVNFMTPFNSKGFPDSLAIAKEESLTIGSIDEVQKLHIRTVPLGEQPRRVCHMESAKAFLVSTIPEVFSGLEFGDGTLRLINDQTFETQDVMQLKSQEQGLSISTVTFANDTKTYFAVGTAFVYPEEPEPTKGRVLILEVKEEKLVLVTEKDIRGAANSVLAFQGKLLAGINYRVHLFQWKAGADGSFELEQECYHGGHIMVLFLQTRGDLIIVGDIMRSVELLVYRADESVIESRAKDQHTAWMMAVDMLDDDTYLGAENKYNLFTLAKNSDAAADEDRSRLDLVGGYHLGEQVNHFQRGSLVMQTADAETSKIPTILYGTVNGSIGVIATIPKELYLTLDSLQNALKKVVKGVGGLEHSSWRAFKNERRTVPSNNFIDGDLVEQFLDLKKDSMQKVVEHMGTDRTVEDLTRQIEELSRALH